MQPGQRDLLWLEFLINKLERFCSLQVEMMILSLCIRGMIVPTYFHCITISLVLIGIILVDVVSGRSHCLSAETHSGMKTSYFWF